MAITYLADSISDSTDTTVTRVKLPGGVIMVQTRLYLSGTYTARASWVNTSMALADGPIPAAILGLSRVNKLLILGMPFEATTVTTTPGQTTNPRSGAVRTNGFLAEYDASIANPSVGLAGGIILYTGTISTNTAGVTSNYAQASGSVATSPAAVGLEILAFRSVT